MHVAKVRSGTMGITTDLHGWYLNRLVQRVCGVHTDSLNPVEVVFVDVFPVYVTTTHVPHTPI